MNMYFADVIGQEWNCLYPHKQEITDDASLARALSHDYVCAEYKGGYRSKENFVRSDCVWILLINNLIRRIGSITNGAPASWMGIPDKIRRN